ncbi:transposable element Tcb2 transposase [Trichonephila clavipes]|nr:transposable element Tcb2 transposase [Trichonephila clavipes]
MIVQLPPGRWQHVSLLLQVCSCRVRQFVDVCCIVHCVQGCLYIGFPSRQTIDDCVCNKLMSTGPGKLIGTNLSFQMNHASIMLYGRSNLLRIKAQHMQLLPSPAYLPDMSPNDHLWYLVGRRFARDPRPAASKDELLLRIQAEWNSLPQADIQTLTPCHVV